jgi:hypothetical protein
MLRAVACLHAPRRLELPYDSLWQYAGFAELIRYEQHTPDVVCGDYYEYNYRHFDWTGSGLWKSDDTVHLSIDAKAYSSDTLLPLHIEHRRTDAAIDDYIKS